MSIDRPFIYSFQIYGFQIYGFQMSFTIASPGSTLTTTVRWLKCCWLEWGW